MDMEMDLKPNISSIRLTLERFTGNPILKPNPKNWWETKAVFNPAAIYEGGKVHILYRAIGETDVSVIGYASSSDGLHIDDRLAKPVYVPREPFEGANPTRPYPSEISGPYVSGGGGMGGCEDPRLSRIGERIYMTYVAYDGYSPPRVALTSIHVNDFLSRNWDWKKPVLISQPNIINKNACIFPEQINGKYVIFHRVFPNILVDFVDDLDFDGKTRWLEGKFSITARSTGLDWDNLKVGSGPPPVKTKEGWLLIYHAVGNLDGYQYKVGAMLLDLKDPTKVIARTRRPILEPAASYENEGWKAGVIYPCGAVIINDNLFVYYGGADMVTCVASTKLNHFLEQLITNHKETRTEPVSVSPITNVPEVSEVLRTVRTELVYGYCMKCRSMQEIKSPKSITLKNFRQTIQGICPRCGSKLSKFVKSEKTSVRRPREE